MGEGEWERCNNLADLLHLFNYFVFNWCNTLEVHKSIELGGHSCLPSFHSPFRLPISVGSGANNVSLTAEQHKLELECRTDHIIHSFIHLSTRTSVQFCSVRFVYQLLFGMRHLRVARRRFPLHSWPTLSCSCCLCCLCCCVFDFH